MYCFTLTKIGKFINITKSNETGKRNLSVILLKLMIPNGWKQYKNERKKICEVGALEDESQ